jgi:hypothetical protein
MTVIGPLRPDEEKMFEGQPKGFPFDNFDMADVMLPEEDADMGIPSEDDDDDEEEVEAESGFGSVIGACIYTGNSISEARRGRGKNRRELHWALNVQQCE